jgi:hypothetical protein
MNKSIAVYSSVGTPSTVLDEGTIGYDFDVEIDVSGRKIIGEVTLCPDLDVNGSELTTFGGSVDAWASQTLAQWVLSLDDRQSVINKIVDACRAAGTME